MSRPMLIAMVQGVADPERDGVADYTRHLSGALAAEASNGKGARVEQIPVDGSVRAVFRAARRIGELRPALVHVQFAPSAFGFSPWPGLLPDLVDTPVVTTMHEYGWWSAPAHVPDALWRVLERTRRFDRESWRLGPAAAAVVTTNAEHAAALRARLGIEPAVVPLAPNVADLGRAEPRTVTRRRLGVPDDAEVVVFFGFVHPVKGLRYLIEAVAELRAAGRRRLHLLVLGGFTSLALPEGEARAFREELTAWTRACGVAGHVTITGHLPAREVSAALHASDLAAFPFTAGATTKSGALLSAFAHGLPTVVTAENGADPELVDGETVVVAPRVRDHAVLRDALSRLLDGPRLRRRVAAGGAALGAQRTWPRIAQQHRELYGRILAGRGEFVRA